MITELRFGGENKVISNVGAKINTDTENNYDNVADSSVHQSSAQ